MIQTYKSMIAALDTRTNRNFKISVIAVMITAGFLISVLYHFYQGYVLEKPYPYTTFLFIPSDRFNDFFVARFVADLNPYFNGNVPGGQFPLVNVFDYLFTLLPLRISLFLFLIANSVIFILLTKAILLKKKESVLQILPIVFLSYPFLFTADRGNLEFLLFTFLLLFLYFFLKEDYVLSSIFLAIAIAMKAFPIILILLYLPQKKYREIIFSISLAALLTLGSLLLFKGGFTANLGFLLQGSIFKAQSAFTGPQNLVQRGVSIFTFLKIILIEMGWLTKVNMSHLLSSYIKIAAFSFIPLAAYVVFVEKILWRQVALLVFSMLLLPHISADYKLLHIYLPMFLFIISDDRSLWDIHYLLIFGFLMIPKDFAYFPNTLSDTQTNDISISVMINILLMILMSLMIIFNGLKNFTLERYRLFRETTN